MKCKFTTATSPKIYWFIAFCDNVMFLHGLLPDWGARGPHHRPPCCLSFFLSKRPFRLTGVLGGPMLSPFLSDML